MKLHHPGRFALLRDSILEVPQAGVELICRGGELWITQDNELQDIVLAPGERFTTPRKRRVLVSALVDAVLEVREPARPAAAMRLLVVRPAAA